MVWFMSRITTIGRLFSARNFKCHYCSSSDPAGKTQLESKEYDVDEQTNVTNLITSYMNRNLHQQKYHPIGLVSRRIINYFYTKFTHRGLPIFSVHDNLNPVVTVKENFDDLLIPKDHVSRAKSDCYYINKTYLLRAHMTAHQSALLKSGLDNFLMVGDVYRRDEIDSTHFPVFHQLDAVRSQRQNQLFHEDSPLRIFELDYIEKSNNYSNSLTDPMKQRCHTLEAVKLMESQLKDHLIGMVKTIFGKTIKYRWVDAYFPFTHPSWELEIFYDNKWMEVLGCGIVRNEIMEKAGSKDSIAYAFGLGLERLAMALYKIPDIRLMWTKDPGFLSQFETDDINKAITYKPVSVYPPCKNDVSFWLPPDLKLEKFIHNDFYDLVRNIGGEYIEQVKMKDMFVHPTLKKESICYTIIYRHLERTLTQSEVNDIHKEIEKAVTKQFNVTIR